MNRASRGEIIEKANRGESIEKKLKGTDLKGRFGEIERKSHKTLRSAVQTFIVASFFFRNLPSHLGKFVLIASPWKRRLQLSLSLTVGGQV